MRKLPNEAKLGIGEELIDVFDLSEVVALTFSGIPARAQLPRENDMARKVCGSLHESAQDTRHEKENYETKPNSEFARNRKGFSMTPETSPVSFSRRAARRGNPGPFAGTS